MDRENLGGVASGGRNFWKLQSRRLAGQQEFLVKLNE